MTDLVQSCGPLRLTKSCPTPTGGIELPVVKYILAARVLWPGLRSTNCVEFHPVLGTEPADHVQIEADAGRPGASLRSEARRPRLGLCGNAINGDPNRPAPTFAPSVVVAE
jgi:hypothetical protein